MNIKPQKLIIATFGNGDVTMMVHQAFHIPRQYTDFKLPLATGNVVPAHNLLLRREFLLKNFKLFLRFLMVPNQKKKQC